MQALPVHFFEWLALDAQPCHAYGGHSAFTKMPDPLDQQVRVCTKNRWHTDSHAYEYVKFPLVYPKDI